MPCMCWFTPSDEDQKRIKGLCKQLVDEIKSLENIGDPIGCRIEDVKKLIDHLYNPSSCKENSFNKKTEIQ